MLKKKERSYSIAVIIIIISISILLLQVALFGFSFSRLNLIDRMEEATQSYYFDKLLLGATTLEKTIVSKWESKKIMAPLLEEIEQKYNTNSLHMDVNMAEILINMITDMNISGGFVFLNPYMGEGTNEEEIFYIKDTESRVKFKDNQDIVLEVGSVDIASRLKLIMDISWRPTMSSQDSLSLMTLKEDIKKDLEDKKSAGYKSFGRWYEDFDLFNRGDRITTYVYPVIDKYTKEVYAFIGIEVGVEVVRDLLEADVLVIGNNSGFILTGYKKDPAHESPNEVKVLTYYDAYLESLVGAEYLKSQAIETSKYKEKRFKDLDLLRLYKDGNEENSYVGIKKDLKIYDSDSPIADRVISLVLLLDEDDFYYQSRSYERVMKKLFIASTITAIVFALILSAIISQPIRRIAKTIEKVDVDKNLKIERSNVVEIDFLLKKIEDLSESVADASSRMQNILEIVGIPFVAIEGDPMTNIVYKTGKFSTLLGHEDPKEPSTQRLTWEEYLSITKQLIKKVKFTEEIEELKEEAQEHIYEIKGESSSIYIRHIKKIISGKNYQIFTDYTSEMIEKLNMEYEKNFDILTALYNRNHFKRLVEDYIKKYPESKAAMVMWDLDNLKYINDTYGHDFGDMYLKETAKIIGSLKREDVFISRFSGDEFFAFIPYEGDEDGLRNIIYNVHIDLLDSKFVVNNNNIIPIRASVGICWYPKDAKNFADLYKYADFAMYGAKKWNKGSINEFRRAEFEKEYLMLSGNEALNKLIEKKLVKFAFQPIVSLQDGHVHAYEALMRTESETIKGVGEVIKLAKVQSKLPQIEKLTFEGVFKTIENKKEKIKGKKIFINSIANVTLPEDALSYALKKLEEYGDSIVIEITEGEEAERISMETKQQYKRYYNTLIAIDDFGAGYSTERSLLRINPEYIKIDMTLIHDIHLDDKKYTLVKNIVEYSRLRGTRTIAEGVENREELKILIKLGLDYVQGYYLARPDFDIKDIDQDKKDEIIRMQALYGQKKHNNNYL